MISAQEWLDESYHPKKNRKNIRELDISQNELEGDLDLSELVNLKILNCSENNLTSLDLSKNKYLEKIICSENKLVNIIVKRW